MRFPEDKAWKGFRLLCRDDRGAVQGWANFTQKSDWPDRRPAHTLQVADLCAATPAATARLWRFLAETDLVVTVSADDRPVDEVLPWLLVDARMAKQTHRNDFVWVRPLDVETMLDGPPYGRTDAVVIEVIDSLGLAAGRYRLDASPDGASCTPTDAAADLTLPARTLGAAYLGGTGRLRRSAGAGWLDAHTDGAVARFGARWPARSRPGATPGSDPGSDALTGATVAAQHRRSAPRPESSAAGGRPPRTTPPARPAQA